MSTQAEYSDGDNLYGVDLDNVVEALSKDGVLTGWTLAQNATPNMSVDVAAGTGFSGGNYVSTGSTTNVIITAAHATLDRLDIIVVNNAGVISAIAGTAATAPNPPDLPDNNICLAIITVDATVTAIYDADITSRRLLLGSIQEEMIGAGEITNAHINAGAAIAYSKLALTGGIVNTDIAGGAAIAWSKIAVDSNIVYKNQTETISAIWQHSDTIRMLSEANVAFQSGGTSYGQIYATAGVLNIEGLNSGNILIGSGTGDVRILQTLKMRTGNDIQFNDSAQTALGSIVAATGELQIMANTGYDVVIGVNGVVFLGATASYVWTSVKLRPNACGTIDFGGTSNRWKDFYKTGTTYTGGCTDIAEWFSGEQGEPGDIYSIDSSGLVIKSIKENDPEVMGAYSEKPSEEMGDLSHKVKLSDTEKASLDLENLNDDEQEMKMHVIRRKKWKEHQVLIALIGTVPTKVIGAVNSGDYLITSNMQGIARAVRASDESPLFVIGRAIDQKSGEDLGKVKMYIEKQILYHNPEEAN